MKSQSKAQKATGAERIVFDGALILQTIEAVRSKLLDMMERHQTFEIDCSAATEIDLSFIQVLLAARTSALSLGKTVALAHPASGVLRDVLQRGGLVGTVAGQADEAFWLQAARA